eukprot:11189189-Lingulodinium_polyedra.AAC.1
MWRLATASCTRGPVLRFGRVAGRASLPLAGTDPEPPGAGLGPRDRPVGRPWLLAPAGPPTGPTEAAHGHFLGQQRREWMQ